MAKYISPQQQQQRDIARHVAALLPAATAAVEALIAGWGGSAPAPAEQGKAIRRTIAPVVEAAGLPSALRYAVSATLADELERPLIAQRLQERRVAEQAAEALVDTSRPVVAGEMYGSRLRAGELVIAGYKSDQAPARVLTCIRSSYIRDVADENARGGWYCEFAEPTAAELATAEFAQLQNQVDAERARSTADDAAREGRRQGELDAIRAEGREPSPLDEIFAGMEELT